MLRRIILALTLALALGACATQIMQGYVGKTLRDAMLDYGPPANAFDMPDGSRAFQWSMTSTYVTPTMVTNSGTVTPVGNTAIWSQHTQITGGQAISGECIYSMFARWDDARNAWVFYDFHRPSLMCS